ncbi:MAG TPA: metal-sensitive transcriptional regulator [Oculatellaceae cyanobacterium]
MSQLQTQKVLNRLARVEGHVRAIYQMVQADRSCPEVLVQIVAVRSALNKVAVILLEDYAEHCLADAAHSGNFKSEWANFCAALDSLI